MTPRSEVNARPRSTANALIRTGALTSATFGVLGFYRMLEDPGGPEDPVALLFLLLGLNIGLAGLSFALSSRARYAVPTLSVSVLSFVTFAALVFLYAG